MLTLTVLNGKFLRLAISFKKLLYYTLFEDTP